MAGWVRWVPVAAVAFLLAAPGTAAAQQQWVDRELDRTVEFSAETRDCRGSDDVQEFDLPARIRNLDVESPDSGDRLRNSDDTRVQVGGIGVRREDDHYELVVGVYGVVCREGRNRWRADVHIKVTYEELVSTTGPAVPSPSPPPPAPSPPPVRRASCGLAPPRIAAVQVLRGNCVTARSVARRYLGTLRSRRVHRVTPFTCFDSPVSGPRKVTCRAAGGRYVWFRYAPAR